VKTWFSPDLDTAPSKSLEFSLEHNHPQNAEKQHALRAKATTFISSQETLMLFGTLALLLFLTAREILALISQDEGKLSSENNELKHSFRLTRKAITWSASTELIDCHNSRAIAHHPLGARWFV
jgi:uncharacterized protein (DUF2345 family)